MIIGAQLFSVRDKFATEQDTYETLEKISSYGYKSVQVSGFPYDASSFKKIADEFNLHIGLTHTALSDIIDNTDKVINDHLILGADVVGLGFPNGYVDMKTREISDIKSFVSTLKEPVKKINDAGLMFGYHNHDMEFRTSGGICPIDYIYEQTSWQFILDVGWCDFAGADTVKYIKKFKNRLKYAHLKDFREALPEDESVAQRIVSLFSGKTPLDEIIKALIENDVYAAYVEQDTAPNYPDSLKEMKKSIDALKIKGWIK